MSQEALSPIKLCLPRKFKIESFTCFICGKTAGKQNFRTPTEQGVKTFIFSLKVRKICNSYPLEEFHEYINFEEEIWIKEREKLRWHANCYSTYCSTQNLSSFQYLS